LDRAHAASAGGVRPHYFEGGTTPAQQHKGSNDITACGGSIISSFIDPEAPHGAVYLFLADVAAIEKLRRLYPGFSGSDLLKETA
jgi:hypothetical protein